MGVEVAFPPAVDLLTQALEHVRQHLNPSRPLGERVRKFWIGVVASRDLAAADVVEDEFVNLARDTGLRAALGRHADEDVRHLIRWGLLRGIRSDERLCRGLRRP